MWLEGLVKVYNGDKQMFSFQKKERRKKKKKKKEE